MKYEKPRNCEAFFMVFTTDFIYLKINSILSYFYILLF
jgi:hypothetical protein